MEKGKLLFDASNEEWDKKNPVKTDKIISFLISLLFIPFGIFSLAELILINDSRLTEELVIKLLIALSLIPGLILLWIGVKLKYFKIYENGIIVPLPHYSAPFKKGNFLAFKDIVRIEITPNLLIIGEKYQFEVDERFIPNIDKIIGILKSRVKVVNKQVKFL